TRNAMFKITKKSVITALSAVALAMPAMAAAQDRYPSKPITFIVPYATSGSSDPRARQPAQHLSATLSAPVLDQNPPGACAKPGGYTIGLGNFAPMAINKSLYGDALPYDPENDIQPIALIERGGMVLAVNTQSPYQSAEELLKDAKANPDKLNYASTGAGGASHLISELFKQRAGFEAIHVPYRGGAPAVNDLMGGNVDMYLELASLFIPHLSAETPRIRALAISTEERIPALPNLPTFKELGIDLVGSNWFGVVAPAGIPADVLTTL